jgi:hypothetical protein
MVERTAQKIKTPKESVFDSLHNNLNFEQISKSFDGIVAKAPDQKFYYCPVLRFEGIDISKVKILKKDIEFEMLARGYKRVKGDDLDNLNSHYSLTENHLTNLKEAGNMFFVPTFVQDGKDNLVMINQIKNDSVNTLNVLVSASRDDIVKRVGRESHLYYSNRLQQKAA